MMDFITVILFSALFFSTIIATVVFLNNKQKVNRIFSFFTFSISLWILTNIAVLFVENISWAIFWSALSYASTAGIATFFFYFTYFFPKKTVTFNKVIHVMVVLTSIIVTVISFIPNVVIQQVIIKPWTIIVGPGIYLVFGYFLFLLIASFVLIIYKRFKYQLDNNEKKQIDLLIVGAISALLFGVVFNLALPFLFANYNYVKLGPVFTLLLIAPVTFAIAKFQLFNIRLIATESFVFLLWGFLLIRLILSSNFYDRLINGGLLIVTFFIGIFLIRSVMREVSQREHIEKLAKDLSTANDRLKELDKQKTEFVSIASHQLRSPLTAIKGYSSMLLEGSFGPVPKKAKEAIDVIFQSSQKMISVIEDFLNITRIELGRMKYEMSDIDVGILARQVTEEQRPQVVKNGLKLEFEDDGHDHNVYADMGKLNQVFNNIIDNAGKYTKEGWIRVRVENLTKPEGDEVVRFVVKDSGVGIPPETLPKLFEKFVRAYDAGKVNLIGTGLGLYVAKQIVEGLGGKIWAESEGKGKGSTFIVELKHTKPLAEQEKGKKVVDFVEGI